MTISRAIPVAVLASLLAARAQAAQEGDKMKGIGMPIMFIAVFIVVVGVAHKHLMNAFQASRSDPMGVGFTFFASLISALMSIFLYFSPAYGYGLVSTVLAVYGALACGGAGLRTVARPMMLANAAWFCVLVGIPNFWSSGIIGATSPTTCDSFYASYSGTMCLGGWVVFVQIISCVQIGLTMLSLFSLMNLALEASSSAPTEGTQAPLRQNEYQAPQSDQPYQKLVQ